MNTPLPAVIDVDKPSIQSAEPSTSSRGPRGKGRRIIFALCAIAVLAWLAARLFAGANVISTDNAYVQGNVIQITPQTNGTVIAIGVDDTDFVRAGQPLVRLDPADARLALDQAESQLAQTVREVRTLYANNDVLSAQISLRRAEVSRLESELGRAKVDLDRRSVLVSDGAVGREEFEHAVTQFASAKSALASTRASAEAAQAQLFANSTLTDRTTVDHHPNVMRASARVREAYLSLRRADVRAPVDGFIARRSVQVGQRVQAGAGLMTVVPLDAIWVDANFKERQLRGVKVGQAATLVSDLYGSEVVYKGIVAGVGAGTGSAFALLPAQNATGNWIKVVQRVPVRITLDPRQVISHPLRIGMSIDVSIQVSQASPGEQVSPKRPMAAVTNVFDGDDRAADATVIRIISENLAIPVPPKSPTVLPRTKETVSDAALLNKSQVGEASHELSQVSNASLKYVAPQ